MQAVQLGGIPCPLVAPKRSRRKSNALLEGVRPDPRAGSACGISLAARASVPGGRLSFPPWCFNRHGLHIYRQQREELGTVRVGIDRHWEVEGHHLHQVDAESLEGSLLEGLTGLRDVPDVGHR